MFERVIFLLLSGEFICRVSQQEAFNFLNRDEERGEVEGYLARIGRRLSKTSHGSGYFLSFVRCEEDERKAIRNHYQEIKGSLTPIVLFFHLLMRATGQEGILMHGAVIQTPVLMAQIDQDPGLRNELQTLATISKTYGADGSHQSMFSRVVRKLKDDGYLVLVNAEQGYYQVTSKVEYLLEVVRFLKENDETLKGDDEERDIGGETRSLI